MRVIGSRFGGRFLLPQSWSCWTLAICWEMSYVPWSCFSVGAGLLVGIISSSGPPRGRGFFLSRNSVSASPHFTHSSSAGPVSIFRFQCQGKKGAAPPLPLMDSEPPKPLSLGMVWFSLTVLQLEHALHAPWKHGPPAVLQAMWTGLPGSAHFG